MAEFPGKSKVAVLKTSPETVVDDIDRLMKLAEVEQTLPKVIPPIIRLAHEKDLGVGDPRQLKIVGYNIEEEPSWNFVQEDTFASKGQKLIYHGPLKPLEKPFLQSPLVPWSCFASNFYHNVYWYPFVGRKRVVAALETKWGQLFKDYGDGKVVMPGLEKKTVLQAIAGLTIIAALTGGLAWLLKNRPTD